MAKAAIYHGKVPRLQSDDRLVYLHAVHQQGIDRRLPESGLKICRERIMRAIGNLLEIGLLSPDLTDVDRLLPVSPELVRCRILSPLQREMDIWRDRVGELRGELETLAAGYADGVAGQWANGKPQVIADLEQVRELIDGLAAEAEREVLTSQPGGGRPEGVLAESLDRTEHMLRRGVRMNTLYQHTARFSQPTIAYVRWVSALGGQVRTTADGFARCLVFDRRVAVVGLPDSVDGAAVVRDSNVVAFIADAFGRCWNGADPVSTSWHRRETMATVHDVQKAIISLLVAGEADAKIAQQVGLSLRSCQRHIAYIMGTLGARNRLQLGYLVAKMDL